MENIHLRGTALGGWLVLEPWLTPSLFYQFLGAYQQWGDSTPSHVGLDSLTFCVALGSQEANRQLQQHWRTWVTESHIAELKLLGVEVLRIPVADWMYVPYEPYIGCMDGALLFLEKALHWCEKYGIKVILDLHALRGSQNGLDNSGAAGEISWSTAGGSASYTHWPTRAGHWAGTYNITSRAYDYINYTNIDSSLAVIETMVKMHRHNHVIIGLEPVNEPDVAIPINVLQYYYNRTNSIIQINAPWWITMLHDSFRLNVDTWSTFMKTCTKCVLDTHIYQAWALPHSVDWFEQDACTAGNPVQLMEKAGIPVVVGEWSLATDNCAMWINGFNDNVPGFPNVNCARVVCPDPYMGFGQPGAPPSMVDYSKVPHGTGGASFVINGTCPTDPPFPDNDNVMRRLAVRKMHAFDLGTHGQFFWNFRTEFEPRWDYTQAVRLGWLPILSNESDFDSIVGACTSHHAASPISKSIFYEHSRSIQLAMVVFVIFMLAMLKPVRQYQQRHSYRRLRSNSEISNIVSIEMGTSVSETQADKAYQS